MKALIVQTQLTKKEFEDKWSVFIGVKHSIAVKSCITALYLSSATLGLKPNDEVIVSDFTWFSTTNVVK